MKLDNMTRAELVDELIQLRRQVSELETRSAEPILTGLWFDEVKLQPVGLAGKEVSCRALGILFRQLRKKGLPPETLAAGIKYPVEHLLNKHEWIDWSSYRRLMANASKIWSDDELVDIGTAFMKSPWSRPISVVAKLLFSAADFYRWTARPGPISGRHFGCIQPLLREHSPNDFEIEIIMLRGYEPCREFYLVTLGVFTAMPTVLGLKPATVEMKTINNNVHYFIEFQSGGGTLAWLRKAISRPFAARAAARELQEANGVLQEKYLELEAQVSERKRAEESPAEERNLLRTLIDNLPDYIYVKDSSSRFIIGNKALAKGMGVATPQELVGKSDFDFHPLKMAEQFYADEQTVVDSGRALINREEAVIGPAGDERWLLTSKVPLRNGRGRFQGLVGIGRDVTELKRAEEALRESQERFQRAFDDAPIGMALVGLDQRLLQVNQALCNILGYTKEALQATTVPAITHPDDRAAEAKYKEQAGEGIVPNLSMEKRYIRADGQVVWGQLSVSTVADGQGAPLYYIGQLEDITERKRADKALRFQKALLEAQNETTLDGILVVSTEKQWLFYNQRFIDMWGFPETIINQESSATALQWAKDLVDDPEQFMLRSQEIYNCPDCESQDEVMLKDGRILDCYSAPVKGSDGEYFGRVWYYRDITDRRKLEEQLRQAQKMEAVGQLAGGVAHNFNNMLTAIMGYAGLALETLQPEHPVANDLRGIQITAGRAADLTQQLLAFTRGQVIEPQILSLNDLVSDTSTMLRQLIAQSIELVILAEPELNNVKVDPSQIEQVLVNLVINAQDAMPNGGDLTIKTSNISFAQPAIGSYAEVQPGHYVLLEVRDTGVGISDDIKEHIFEPFFTTKDVGQGTGLGLATCFGIVKQNRGYIEFANNPGNGTTFRVYLPCYDGELGSKVEGEISQDLPEGRETVILVEDEESVRELAGRVLRQLGYTVIEATNGSDALEAVERQAEQAFHLLVTDVVMPHIGGDTLAKRLRSRYPSLKVLFMSGYTDDDVISQSIPDHSVLFLQKPFATAELARKVRQVLDSD